MAASHSTPLEIAVSCDRQASWGPAPTFRSPLLARSLPGMPSDIVKVSSLVGGLWVAGRSSPRFAIASEVKEIQWREASSKRDNTSVMCGRTLGFPSQHLSASIQTSSERPRISRFCGREGRLLSRTSKGTMIG